MRYTTKLNVHIKIKATSKGHHHHRRVHNIDIYAHRILFDHARVYFLLLQIHFIYAVFISYYSFLFFFTQNNIKLRGEMKSRSKLAPRFCSKIKYKSKIKFFLAIMAGSCICDACMYERMNE